MITAGSAASVTFPQYRKYKNDKSYFKISSMTIFEEIKRLPGGRYQLFEFSARILPDRNFVADMLFDHHEYWDVIEEEEYLAVREKTTAQ